MMTVESSFIWRNVSCVEHQTDHEEDLHSGNNDPVSEDATQQSSPAVVIT